MELQCISDADDALEDGEIQSPDRSEKPKDPMSDFYETISELSDEETPRKPKVRRRPHRRRRSRTRARTRPRTHTLRDRRMNDFDEMRKRYLERLKENRRREEDLQRVVEVPLRKQSVEEIRASGAGVEDMDIEEPTVAAYPIYEVSSQESEPQASAGSSHEYPNGGQDSEEEIDLLQLRALALDSKRTHMKFAGNDSDSEESTENEFNLRAEALKTAVLKKRKSIQQKMDKRKDKLKVSIENKKNVQANRSRLVPEAKKPVDEGVGKENKKDAVNDTIEDENALREMLLATLARKDVRSEKDPSDIEGSIETVALPGAIAPNSLVPSKSPFVEPAPPLKPSQVPPRRLSQTISELIQVFGDSESSPQDMSVEPELVYTPSVEKAVRIENIEVPNRLSIGEVPRNPRTIALSKYAVDKQAHVDPLVQSSNQTSNVDPERDMFSDSFRISKPSMSVPNSILHSVPNTDTEKPTQVFHPSEKLPVPIAVLHPVSKGDKEKDTHVPTPLEIIKVSKTSVPIFQNFSATSQASKWKPVNQVVRTKQSVRGKPYNRALSARESRRKMNSKENLEKSDGSSRDQKKDALKKIPTPMLSKPASQKLAKTVDNGLSKHTTQKPAKMVANTLSEPASQKPSKMAANTQKRPLPSASNLTNKKPRNGKEYPPLVVSKVHSPAADQRIVIHLGAESSDEENEEDKECSNVSADIVNAVDNYLLNARMKVEKKVPSALEAVRSHLPPSQLLEYTRLVQQLAEKTGSKVVEPKQTDSPGSPSPALKEITITCQNTSAIEEPAPLNADLGDLRAKLEQKRRSSNEELSKPGPSVPKLIEIPVEPPPSSVTTKVSSAPIPPVQRNMINLRPVNQPIRAPDRSRHKFVKTASKESIELAKIGQLMAALKRELAAENAARDALARLRQEIIVIEQKKLEHSNRSTLLRARIKKLLGPNPNVLSKPMPLKMPPTLVTSNVASTSSYSAYSNSSKMAASTITNNVPSRSSNSAFTTVDVSTSAATLDSSTPMSRRPISSPKKDTSIRAQGSPNKGLPGKTTALTSKTSSPATSVPANSTATTSTSGCNNESLNPHVSGAKCQQKASLPNAMCSTPVTTIHSNSLILSAVAGSPTHASEAPNEVNSAEDLNTSSQNNTVTPHALVNYVSPLVSLVSGLDPMRELCPHDLTGVCRDESCQYQHFRVK